MIPAWDEWRVPRGGFIAHLVPRQGGFEARAFCGYKPSSNARGYAGRRGAMRPRHGWRNIAGGNEPRCRRCEKLNGTTPCFHPIT